MEFYEAELHGLIAGYYQNKESMENYKKIVDEENAEIKKRMSEHNLDEFTTMDGFIAKVITQKKESFNEELLLAKLKELGIDKAIKTKEYVDMDELENLIYNGELNACQLNNCRIVKEVKALKVTKKKGE